MEEVLLWQLQPPPPCKKSVLLLARLCRAWEMISAIKPALFNIDRIFCSWGTKLNGTFVTVLCTKYNACHGRKLSMSDRQSEKGPSNASSMHIFTMHLFRYGSRTRAPDDLANSIELSDSPFTPFLKLHHNDHCRGHILASQGKSSGTQQI